MKETAGENPKMEANFSMLVMSIASSAAMSLGIAPHPQTGKVEKDKEMARFNIDLLLMLKEKTKNNLTDEEKAFLDSLVTDLQMKFIQM
ncbi:MAG: DUF1844 domain-containing protein [Bdellovibrionaceae bacterium]|nr:DUF1844 domain-containing protein [Pseudobdellovibrionaceae bacterium]MBX3034184.1 DUF1844 domain-containing protein [Pseudobdellovibrionaceae bacterium]